MIRRLLAVVALLVGASVLTPVDEAVAYSWTRNLSVGHCGIAVSWPLNYQAQTRANSASCRKIGAAIYWYVTGPVHTSSSAQKTSPWPTKGLAYGTKVIAYAAKAPCEAQHWACDTFGRCARWRTKSNGATWLMYQWRE